MSDKNNKKLKTGITTGTCAAAAAKAAAHKLLSGKSVLNVNVMTKNSGQLFVNVTNTETLNNIVKCSVIKYSGDDPDVTNGVKVIASVYKTDAGITIEGGEGVGTVTMPGLKIPVGKPAINPVPLQMIEAEVLKEANAFGYSGGFNITISVLNGAEIAKKTMNERLGIIGGLSILGTTGIVEPMSEKALIDTIKAEIDVHLAKGIKRLIVTPGNYGRQFAERNLGVNIETAVKCSNYIGEMLDYANYAGAEQVFLIGHAGKLVKVAGGIMNTHSSAADCRMEIIAAHLALLGADTSVIRKIMECKTVQAAIDIIKETDLHEAVWRSIGEKIGFYLYERTKGRLPVKFVVFTEEHGVLINMDSGNCK